MSELSSELTVFGDINERLASAEVVGQFSDSNDKVVELMQDDAGQFVRRTYQPQAVRDISRSAGGTFAEAWQGYNDMFSNAGIKLIPSMLIEGGGLEQVIVAEYLGEITNDQTVAAQPLEAKKQLAGSLGRLLNSTPGFMPDAQGFAPEDAFVIYPPTGELRVLDIDPYVHARNPYRYLTKANKENIEGYMGAFLKTMEDRIKLWTQDAEERQAMSRAFVLTAGHALPDEPSMRLLGLFSNIHMMGHGVDLGNSRFR